MTATGLALGVRGVVGKEVRSRTRGWRPMLVLTVYLLIVTLAVVAVLGISVNSSGTISPTLGQVLFAALAGGSVLLVSFIAPALTAGSISGERERLTLDLMLVTRASALGLVTGKLLGAMLWVVYLLVASLPALGVVYLFGGVPLLTVIAALVVTISTALGYTALGILLSAMFRRTAIATVLAYGVVLITTIALPIVSVSLGLSSLNSALFSGGRAGFTAGGDAPAFGLPPPQAWLAFASPAMALVSVLGGQFGQTIAGLNVGMGAFSVYFIRPVANTPTPPELVTSFAAWVFHAAINVVFAILALLAASRWLTPRTPGPGWRRAQRGS